MVRLARCICYLRLARLLEDAKDRNEKIQQSYLIKFLKRTLKFYRSMEKKDYMDRYNSMFDERVMPKTEADYDLYRFLFVAPEGTHLSLFTNALFNRYVASCKGQHLALADRIIRTERNVHLLTGIKWTDADVKNATLNPSMMTIDFAPAVKYTPFTLFLATIAKSPFWRQRLWTDGGIPLQTLVYITRYLDHGSPVAERWKMSEFCPSLYLEVWNANRIMDRHYFSRYSGTDKNPLDQDNPAIFNKHPEKLLVDLRIALGSGKPKATAQLPLKDILPKIASMLAGKPFNNGKTCGCGRPGLYQCGLCVDEDERFCGDPACIAWRMHRFGCQ
jgi:hypothetical protein